MAYICPNCGCALGWGADFTAEEYGFNGEGIVSTFSCQNCGVDVLQVILYNNEEESDGE